MKQTRQTLVDLHHPAFRKGYEIGRQHYFQEQMTLTDKMLVESLRCIFLESEQDEGEKREIGVYSSIGQLVGTLSGGVIPKQPHEDCTQDWQEALLVTVQQEYGAAFSAMIRLFWITHDQLAEKLDAETFELMLMRGLR